MFSDVGVYKKYEIIPRNMISFSLKKERNRNFPYRMTHILHIPPSSIILPYTADTTRKAPPTQGLAAHAGEALTCTQRGYVHPPGASVHALGWAGVAVSGLYAIRPLRENNCSVCTVWEYGGMGVREGKESSHTPILPYRKGRLFSRNGLIK